MTDHVVVDRTRTKLLPPNSPEKGYQITREAAAELGIIGSAENPPQVRRPAFDAASAITPDKPKRKYTKRK